ncbi:MAG: response regulator [Anaerolineales bacterium]|jgi:DNA-binding response OmpR family regulator
MSKHILIVDDDDLMRRSLALSMDQAGYKASNAANAEDALMMARREPPDLVLLDIGLPGMDGLDALRRFKDELGIPVIFMTARRRNLDEILGLELGADDYITKPFDVDVLLAHVKATLRRSESVEPKIDTTRPIILGDLKIDPGAHTVEIAGEPIELRPREFALLHTLALQPGMVVSVDDLLASIWGAEYIGEPQVVYVHIRWLRKKIEENPDDPKRILTVHGVGYKLDVPEE